MNLGLVRAGLAHLEVLVSGYLRLLRRRRFHGLGYSPVDKIVADAFQPEVTVTT